MDLKNIVAKALQNKQSISFIIINIVVAFLGFTRSFVFIEFLNLEELGLITLIQTGAMFVGFFQIGLINGGYRIIALQKKHLSEKTNNVIFSYFGVLFVFLMFVYFTGFFVNIFDKKIIILLTLLIGLSLLIVNWLTNVLIASRNLVLLNRVNLISSILSVLSLPLAFYFGIFGGAFVILIQPTVFIILILVKSKTLRPTDFILNIIEIKKILHYGFIPFLSGLFFLIYVQIERWSINLFLGTAALGSLYLFFLITALWVLVPTSIMNLFFPRGVAFYDGKKIFQFKKIIQLHFYIVIVYSVILILGLMIFLGPFVEYVFPQHTPYVKFVLYAIPGFVFRSLRDPISTFLNSVVKLKPMLYSDIASLSIYCAYIYTLWIFDKCSVVNFVIGFNIYFILKFITVYIPYKKLNSNLTNINDEIN